MIEKIGVLIEATVAIIKTHLNAINTPDPFEGTHRILACIRIEWSIIHDGSIVP